MYLIHKSSLNQISQTLRIYLIKTGPLLFISVSTETLSLPLTRIYSSTHSASQRLTSMPTLARASIVEATPERNSFQLSLTCTPPQPRRFVKRT